MPKIAIFMSSLAGGGMERAMLNLAEFFVKQGASVDLLVASADGALISEVPELVNIIDLKSTKSQLQSARWWLLKAAMKLELKFMVLFFVKKLPKAVKVIPGLVNYIEDSSPDVILSTPTTANLSVIWAKSYCGYRKKIVVREASTLSEEICNKKTVFFRLAEGFVRKWYRHADVVICVSDGVKQDLSKNFFVDKQRLKTIYNILDVEKIKRKAVSSEHDLLITSFGKYILSAGRLEKAKDHETLIRAYHMISDDTAADLVILGEGSERLNLEKLISELSLTDRVHLPGFYVNPYPYIKNCEVFALSSRWEGCPNVLREALVLNKKIISTDCPSGAREVLSNGTLGQLVEVGNVDQLAKALRESLIENGYVHNITIDEMNEVSIEQYQKLFFEIP